MCNSLSGLDALIRPEQLNLGAVKLNAANPILFKFD